MKRVYFGNTLGDYAVALAIVVASLIVLRVFHLIVLKRLKVWASKTETHYDDLVVSALDKFGMPIFGLLVMYWGINSLTLSEKASRVIEIAFSAALAFFIIRLLTTATRYLLENAVRKHEGSEEKVKQMRGVILLIHISIWMIGLLILFSNLGYDVTAIVAGLGVGGIAIALAAQNILGDLFNYFVIFFDRPIEVGDYITLDDKKGTVEHIGIKTTRLKSLSGEQLVISNSDLSKSRIHNFKRMDRRRIVFSFGVVYETPKEKLAEIPEIIKKILANQPLTTLDRSHFASFGNFSLNFETVYFVESNDYNVYMDIQQKVNLAIVEEFAKHGIAFAFPTQTVYVNSM